MQDSTVDVFSHGPRRAQPNTSFEGAGHIHISFQRFSSDSSPLLQLRRPPSLSLLMDVTLLSMGLERTTISATILSPMFCYRVHVPVFMLTAFFILPMIGCFWTSVFGPSSSSATQQSLPCRMRIPTIRDTSSWSWLCSLGGGFCLRGHLFPQRQLLSRLSVLRHLGEIQCRRAVLYLFGLRVAHNCSLTWVIFAHLSDRRCQGAPPRPSDGFPMEVVCLSRRVHRCHTSPFCLSAKTFLCVYRFNGCELAPLLVIFCPANSNCKADKDDTPCMRRRPRHELGPQSASEDSLKSDDEPRHPPTMAQFLPPPLRHRVVSALLPTSRCAVPLVQVVFGGRVCHVPFGLGTVSLSASS